MDTKYLKSRLTLDNLKREAMNTMWVTTGLIGATLIDRLVQKGIEKFWPTAPDWVKYVKPLGPILTGFGLSVFAKPGEEGNMLRLIGYGTSAAGAVSALRLIPQFDQLMSGTPSAEKTVGSLNGMQGISLGDFGNVREIATADAEPTSVDLPDLGRSANDYASRREVEIAPEEFEEVFAEIM